MVIHAIVLPYFVTPVVLLVFRVRHVPAGGGVHFVCCRCLDLAETGCDACRALGLEKRRTGTKVTVLIDDLDIRVLDRDTGKLTRKLVLDPTRDYQPRGVKCGNSPKNRLSV